MREEVHTLQVHVHHTIKLRFAGFGNQGIHARARVVHQEVELRIAIFLLQIGGGFRHKILTRFGFRGIVTERLGLTPQLLNFGDYRLGFLLMAMVSK